MDDHVDHSSCEHAAGAADCLTRFGLPHARFCVLPLPLPQLLCQDRVSSTVLSEFQNGNQQQKEERSDGNCETDAHRFFLGFDAWASPAFDLLRPGKAA